MTSRRPIRTTSLDFCCRGKQRSTQAQLAMDLIPGSALKADPFIGMADGVLRRMNHQEQPSPGFVIEMKRELCRWSKVAFSKILRNNSRMVDPTNLFSQMCDHQHMCGIWGKSGQVSSSEADFTILSRHVSSSSSVWLNVEILITSVEPHRSAALL